MKNNFEIMEKAIKAGEIPTEDVVNSFLEDSNKMMSFEGDSTVFNEDFKKACNDFKSAFDSKDLTLLQEKIVAIDAITKICHEKFK